MGGQALAPPPQEGRRCAAYDIDYDAKYMDILQPEGYAVALYNVLRVRPGGSLTLAPVCSSWVWLHFGENSKLYTFLHMQSLLIYGGIFGSQNNVYIYI